MPIPDGSLHAPAVTALSSPAVGASSGRPPFSPAGVIAPAALPLTGHARAERGRPRRSRPASVSAFTSPPMPFAGGVDGANSAACFVALRRRLEQLLDHNRAGDRDATPPETLAILVARQIADAASGESAAIANQVIARAVLWAVLEYEGVEPPGAARGKAAR